MIWQEWCLVLAMLLVTLEIGFYMGKTSTINLVKELQGFIDGKK